MRLVFAGTPVFAAASLDALLAAGHEVVLVLTQPDRPAGRGMKLQASPVKQCAEKAGIPVYQPERLKTPESWEPIRQAGADLMVVVAYGLILPQAVLDIPRMGCVNVHASLLPRWRGAAPIHRAIEAGDTETGVCIMQMEAGLDTGPVLSRVALSIDSRETTQTLHDRLAEAGAQLLCETLAQPLPPAKLQPAAGVTYAHKISKEESLIDWRGRAVDIDRKVRAFNPFPAVSFTLDGQTVKVWASELVDEFTAGEPGEVLCADAQGILVSCGEGVLRLTQIQPAGARRMSAGDYLAGHSLPVGTRLV